jgi:formylglycine-generating enzyme required for sulfatase activity
MTFTTVRGPVEFLIGAPAQEPNATPSVEARHLVRIERSFAIGATEVKAAVYHRFLRDHPEFRREDVITSRAGPEGPVETVDVFEAAAFCRWLGEREGMQEDQQCYPTFAEILEAGREGHMPLDPGYLRRPGYRLPTEAEWEFACRAGSQVSRPFGRSAGMLPRYAWSMLNSGERAHRAGELKPNDLGLFDVLGNVHEWCQDDGKAHRPNFGGRPVVDNEELDAVSARVPLVLKGGAHTNAAPHTRSAYRLGWPPNTRLPSVGFRIARSLP